MCDLIGDHSHLGRFSPNIGYHNGYLSAFNHGYIIQLNTEHHRIDIIGAGFQNIELGTTLTAAFKKFCYILKVIMSVNGLCNIFGFGQGLTVTCHNNPDFFIRDYDGILDLDFEQAGVYTVFSRKKDGGLRTFFTTMIKKRFPVFKIAVLNDGF